MSVIIMCHHEAIILISDVRELHWVLPNHLILSEKKGRSQSQELWPQGLETRRVGSKLTKVNIRGDKEVNVV